MKLKALVTHQSLIGLASHAMAQNIEPRSFITGPSIQRIQRTQREGALPVQVNMQFNININGNGLDNLTSNVDVVDGATRGIERIEILKDGGTPCA